MEYHRDVLTAIIGGDFDLAKELIDKGAEIPDSAISFAINYRSVDMVKFLFEHDAKIPENAITTALFSGSLAMVKYLVEEHN